MRVHLQTHGYKTYVESSFLDRVESIGGFSKLSRFGTLNSRCFVSYLNAGDDLIAVLPRHLFADLDSDVRVDAAIAHGHDGAADGRRDEEQD
jgi:hypothetical protein